MFEMKDPDDKLVYVDEIIDNEVVLVGQADVKDDNGYIKYLDESDNVYWYDSANGTLYNSSYEEATGVELDTLTKQTKVTSLFGEEGDYTFEVSLYGNDSKLTSVYNYITANKEQVIVDGEEVQESITILDNLISDLSEKIEETNNLDIEAEKEEHTTTITITRKDGTSYDVEVLDGEKGEKGDKGDAGAIKMQIVQVLPETGSDDTIYLVPLEEPDVQGNNYAEYIYVNGEWELLGKIGVQVDLTDYATIEYVDSLVGDIEIILTTLDVGGGI